MNKRTRLATIALHFLCNVSTIMWPIQNARAQSSPGLVYGQVPTPAQWNSYFAAKQDLFPYTPVNKAGDSMLGTLTMLKSTSTAASLNIPPAGTAPLAPKNGDIWSSSTTQLNMQLNGITAGFLFYDGVLVNGQCLSINSNLHAVASGSGCGGGGGGGTVNAGNMNQLGYYAGSGAAISGLTSIANGVLVTGTGGDPSISQTLPIAVQANIVNTGVLTSGTTGAGFTVAFGTATLTGIVPAGNLPLATSGAFGAIKGDGVTLPIVAGVISCNTATNGTLGCVRPDGSSVTISGGVLSAATTALPGETNYACTGSGDVSGVNTALATGKTVHVTGAICSIASDIIFTVPGQRMYCEGRTITTFDAVASAGGFTKGLLYFNTGEPGPTIENCGFGFPNQVDTAVRSNLTNYPPAIFAQNTPRFRLLHDRITLAMAGVDLRGNSGGSLIDDMEMSCLSVCYWIDGSQDTVRIVNSHSWPFGLTTNQETLALTPNSICVPQTVSGTIGAPGAIGLWSGRMDGLILSNDLWLIGTMNCFEPGQGNRTGVPWLDGETFGSIDNSGYDTEQGIVFNQPAGTWASTVTNSQTLSSSNVLHFAATPMFIGGICQGIGTVPYDISAPTAIQSNNTIVSCTATTVTLTSNVNSTVANGDTIAGQAHNQGNVNASSTYFSGATNSDAAIVMHAGVFTCVPCNFGNGSGGVGAQVQQNGGVLNVGYGFADHGGGDLPFYNGSGGYITIHGMQFNVTAGSTQSQSIIHIQSGSMEANIQGNHISDHGTGTGTFLQVDADGFHNIIGNSSPGWTYTLPTCTVAICTANN